MNLDLSSHRVSRLSLQMDLETNEANARNAWDAAGFEMAHPTDEGSHYLETAAYRRAGQQYLVIARLITGGDTNVRMNLDYHSEGDPVRIRELRTNLDRLGGILSSLGAPCILRCSAMTTYSLDSAEPLLALPLLRFTTSHSFFDEIRGVRLARLSEDGSETESVALDMDEHGHLNVFTMTSFHTVSSAQSPTDALRRIVSLRAKAVELK